MAEQKLDLLQFAAGGVAQTSARSPQIVRRQGFDAHTGGAVSHYVPNYVLSYPVSPNRPILANGAEQLAGDDGSTLSPCVDCRFDPCRYRHCPHMPGFADKVDDRPVILRRWMSPSFQRHDLRAPETATK